MDTESVLKRQEAQLPGEDFWELQAFAWAGSSARGTLPPLHT